MRQAFLWRLLVVVSLSIWTPIVAATVCRLPGLSGFDDAARRAKVLLPPTTRDARRAVVYIEKTPDGLYFHSNFISEGADYPTKIGRERIDDGAAAFVNIVHPERPSDVEWRETEGIFREHVRVMLDVSVFDAEGRPALDLGGVKNVMVVDGRAGRSLTGSVEVLSTKVPPPLLLGKAVGCCVSGIPPHLAKTLGDRMRARPLRRDGVAFLSLVKDSGTATAVSKTTLVRERVAGTVDQIRTLADIESVFQAQRGKTVVMIAHTEGARYVGRAADRSVLFEVPISDVRAAARRYDVELVDLGCNTARHVSIYGNVGVTTRFNSVEAVQAVERALVKAENYAEFFEGISSEGLKVVVDPLFVARSELRAAVFAPVKASVVARSATWWQKVADVFVTFRN